MSINWDALNQAARASDAELTAVNAVLRALGDLADRLDARARGPVAPAVSDAYGAVSRDLRAVCETLAAEVTRR